MKSSHSLAVATAVLAAALGIGNAVAQDWPTPIHSCSSQNAGDIAQIPYFNHLTGQRLTITYFCSGTDWQLIMVCDLSQNGLCMAY